MSSNQINIKVDNENAQESKILQELKELKQTVNVLKNQSFASAPSTPQREIRVNPLASPMSCHERKYSSASSIDPRK